MVLYSYIDFVDTLFVFICLIDLWFCPIFAV